MILWLDADGAPSSRKSGVKFRAGVSVSLSAPSTDSGDAPVLQYSFSTGDASQPMAPTYVEWRLGNGINTGIHVLATNDYLYDATAGPIGFRARPNG
jgi:hypothetical protein